ncbi:MAG: Flavin-dependent monooxygenase, reductase subunit HsaB [Acidimicrobiales bacterium]|nr:Flavin-dependent monooxygenase, reductase subunit HsaB [Acidimicrobiales bacterium]
MGVSPIEFDSNMYREVLGHFPTGVTVISALDQESPVGLAVGSFFSVSLDPPLVGFCADKGSTTFPKIRRAGRFCVNILAEDQHETSNRFAGKGEDKYQGIEWEPSHVTGSPMIKGSLAHIDCELENVHEAGDHFIALGRVKALEAVRSDTGPLLFFKGRYGSHSDM